MDSFDFDLVERELNVTIPDVFRDFMTRARELGLAFRQFEFRDNARDLIDDNLALREGFKEIWQDHFLAVLPDGCGNYFTLDASSVDADHMVIVAHDPFGVEEFGPASGLFAEYLKNTQTGN